MNHVYGRGDVPKDLEQKEYEATVDLENFFGKTPVSVDVEVSVRFKDNGDPYDAWVTSVKFLDHDVTKLVLSGWEEYELINGVMGNGFVDSLP